MLGSVGLRKSITSENMSWDNLMDRTLRIAGVEVPRFLYGTAWKEDATHVLVGLALALGFRGIDTANQRKHYDEAAVGRAISAAIAGGLLVREELFVQTKYTFQRGQDHRLPYNPDSSISTQVEESFASSLQHLAVEQIDSYVLHGPSSPVGFNRDDWAAWQAMENIFDSGRTRLLGVSNVSLDQLESLCRDAKVLPHFVQNRCYAIQGWGKDVRDFCKGNGLHYQGFSLLTANGAVMASRKLAKMAERHNCSIAQVVFRFAIDVGMIPLTGTTTEQHMRSDLEIFDIQLSLDEIECISNLMC